MADGIVYYINSASDFDPVAKKVSDSTNLKIVKNIYQRITQCHREASFYVLNLGCDAVAMADSHDLMGDS